MDGTLARCSGEREMEMKVVKVQVEQSSKAAELSGGG
jgi:hypothetical protein